MFMFSDAQSGLLIVFGVVSGVLSTFAYAPYIRDTIGRRTQPQRASWLIWSVLGSIAFFSQVHEGAGSSLWFAGVQVGGTIAVFLLSIRLGVGGFLKRSDCLVLACAASGLVLWYFTENAAYALAITTGISLLGGGITVLKAYRSPQSETMATWFLSFIASGCAILSVGGMDWVLLAYPLYLFVLNGAIVLAIMLGRMQALQEDGTILQRSALFPISAAPRAPLHSLLLRALRPSFPAGSHQRGSIGRWHPPAAG